MRMRIRSGNGRSSVGFTGAPAGFGGAVAGFSVPSFAVGLAVGAVVAVAAVYLFGPGAGEGSPEAQYEPPVADAPDFEFWERP